MNIIGARGDIDSAKAIIEKAGRLEKGCESTIQLFRADRVFGKEHIQMAAECASRAMGNGTARSETLGMEALLYAAAERQITEAIRKLGITDETENFAILIMGQASDSAVLEILGLERDDSVLDPRGKDHSIFGFTGTEIAAVGEARLPELILEAVALSELDRK